MAWTRKDIRDLKLKHNLQEARPKKTVLAKFLTKTGKISVEKETIEKLLWVMHREKSIPAYVTEHQFMDDRMFRFDWAIPTWKLAIEYEGLMSEKSGHTTVTGFTSDCEKYNLAQLAGWKVLRYTVLNHQNLGSDLRSFIEKRNN